MPSRKTRSDTMRTMYELPLPPTPGTEAHVSIALANSVINTGNNVQDALNSPESTTDWLIARGLVSNGSALQSYCQNRLVGLRHHVQAALSVYVSGSGQEPAPATLEGINSALVAAPHSPTLRFTPESGFFRELAHPTTELVEHAMSVIAEDLAALLTGDEAAQLARCEAEPCTRFFLRTHGRRQWCSTRCGDRVRAARAYARKRALITT